MTVLEDLWYGNINPHETFLEHDHYYRKLLSLMGRNRDELNDTLTEKQKEVLEKYDDTINEMQSIAEQSAFQYGFSLGVRLMIESVSTQITDYDI